MQCTLNHVKITGIKTVIPSQFIDIDDELQYFNNDPKKLARAKKMLGYGRRYFVDKDTTVTDLCIDAAEKLFSEMDIDRNSIDLLIFVNQKPDYKEPCDACIAHGALKLQTSCATLNIVAGCSGYVHALWTAHAMIASGSAKKCLLLAGDIPSFGLEQTNRKSAPLFGDAASATLLEYTAKEHASTFILGTDGANWDKIVAPFGGTRLPIDKESLDLKVFDDMGNMWTSNQTVTLGEDVLSFTISIVPPLINETVALAGLANENIDLFVIHQVNKRMLESIAARANIAPEKVPTETFTKYANTSTNSIPTTICDQLFAKKANNIVICGFGSGFSWGCGLVNVSSLYNGGISTYIPPDNKPSRSEQISHWIKYFTGKE